MQSDSTDPQKPALETEASSWPNSGRLAGVDYGTVRIGVAVSDPSQHWVNPLTTYNRRTLALDGDFFRELTKQESIVGWVVGLPIHCDGKESIKSAEAREFGSWLQKLTDRPVRFVDERFSSSLANQLLAPAELSRKKNKKQIDRVAAMVILQSFLESQSHSEGHGQRVAEQHGAGENPSLDDDR